MGRKPVTKDNVKKAWKQSHRLAFGSRSETLILIVIALVAVIVALLTTITVDTKKLSDYCARYRGLDQTPVVVTSGNSAQFNSVEQRAIIKQIVDIGNTRNLGYRGIMLGLMVAMQESRIRNLKYGHLDSVGIYQQRPSQGWGTREQILDPEYAINKFYDALEGVQGWQSMSYLDAALAVQRPSREAYLSANNYFPGWEPAASKILKGSEDTEVVTTSVEPIDAVTQLCDQVLLVYGQEQSKLEKILLAALSREGDAYEWGEPFDGAAFICWAFETEDVKVPCTPGEHATFEGDKKLGVAVEYIDGDDIRSGAETLIPGDVLFESDDPEASSPEDATDVSMFQGSRGSELIVASFNVLGSSHTTDPGGFDPGPVRFDKQFELITSKGFTVVGLQEFQRNQRERFRELAGEQWGIWPNTPSYTDKNGAIHADNTIIWDKAQVKLVQGCSLPMPEYFNGPRNIPCVELEHLASGQRFFVADTHDPTKDENAFKRFRAANQHADDSEEMAAQLPTFFVGDFNQGTGLRYNQNNTYGNERLNLTWCVMTKSGTMQFAYDALKQRTGQCPKETSEELGDGEVDMVFTSEDVTVTDYQVIKDRAVTQSDHPVVYAKATTALIGQQAAGESLGDNVGADPTTGVITIQPTNARKLVGVLRYTLTLPEFSGNGTWTLPVAKGTYTLTARFGECGSLWINCHTGLDFDTDAGVPVMAMTGGEILSAELSGAYGNRIVVVSPDGSEQWYCHLSGFAVEDGYVEAGQVIGYVGQTGNVTGAHLHVETRVNGTPVDPFEVLVRQGLNP